MAEVFGIVPTGQPLITVPSSSPNEFTQLYNLPARPFSHFAVFLLPGKTMPPGYAASIYLASITAPDTLRDYKFLGAIGPGKESAIFKIGSAAGSTSRQAARSYVVGISVEQENVVAQKMAQLTSESQIVKASSTSIGTTQQKADTLALARRIIGNAFNFLGSFSSNVPVPEASGVQGMDVVPLKAFQDWWTKFESKVINDPSFLDANTE